MTIQETLNKARKILKENKIEDAGIITKILLSHILLCKKEELIINNNKEIEETKEKEFFERNRQNIKWLSYTIHNRKARIYENGI